MKGLLAACLAVAISIAGAAVSANDLKEIKVTQATASFAFLPISYAKAAGFYEEEGLDVQQISTRGGGPDLTALISGDVDFNASAGTYQISALSKGRELVNVYNFYKRNLMGVVISREAFERLGVSEDAPLEERAAALKGLKMAVSRPGALSDKQVRHAIRLGGLEPGVDTEIVAVGGAAAMLSAMEQGLVDGFAVSPPTDRIAVDRGVAVMWIDNPAGDDPSVDPFMMESILTTREYFDENPETIAKIVRATKRAVNAIAASTPAEVFAVVQEEFSKFDEDVAVLAIEAVIPALNMTGEVSQEMAANTLLLDGRSDVVNAEQLWKTYVPPVE